MMLYGLWSNTLATDIENYGDTGKAITNLLTLTDAARQYSTEYLIEQELLYSAIICGISFSNWIYDYSTPELSDLKKELSIRLNKAKYIGANDYQNIEERIRSMRIAEDKYFLISLFCESELCAYNKKSYYSMKRWYLAASDSRGVFASDMRECFEKLFFHGDADSSLNTLNNDFDRIKNDIVHHLECLDSYHMHFREHRKMNDSNTIIGQKFKEFCGIDCSPQSDRHSARLLDRDFYNDKLMRVETLRCEMHTKFNKSHYSHDKQDRIYFHPGKEGIMDERVLVVHIGRHL